MSRLGVIVLLAFGIAAAHPATAQIPLGSFVTLGSPADPPSIGTGAGVFDIIPDRKKTNAAHRAQLQGEYRFGDVLWIFAPLLKSQLEKSPLSNAMIRTTQAATIFESGVKENVLPTRARAVVNVRILTGETIAGVIDQARRVIDDSVVKISPLSVRVEPSGVSDTESKV